MKDFFIIELFYIKKLININAPINISYHFETTITKLGLPEFDDLVSKIKIESYTEHIGREMV